ncbi:hypothetical protein [Streptomyces halobius]|uniref:YD repeat-containing protein n=1 Tax=Streptomyces halobius TaxID=2879846 RepID=A0ABY4M498_9ACTN|nr:hypothetical protein [Streptomyces halobius]UQA91649.1 hypothetical protein K9S39_07040 [Streptomyces halobius]
MTERSNNYPTGDPSGMSFIANRWTFTGPQGYRVVFDGDGYTVLSYNGAEERPVPHGRGLSEDDAHALAARLSGRG